MSLFIYGKNAVKEVIKSNHKVYKVLITKNVLEKETEIFSLLKSKNINYKIIEKTFLDKQTDVNHQGVCAEIEDYKYYEVMDLLKTARSRDEQPFIIILDGLEDPHNLGAIMRTADSIGAHGIIIPKNRSVQLNATVAKLSTGAIEHVKVARVTNLVRTIEDLKKAGLWIAATDASDSQDYRSVDYTGPIAIVIGSEGKGVSRLVKKNSDFAIRLPMIGHVTSLNASVAAAITMYEVYNQRNPL